MRTHADRAGATRGSRDRGPRPNGGVGDEAVPGDVRAAVPSPLTPAGLARVQRLAGNRAATNAAHHDVVQRETVVQRDLSVGQVARLAERLHDAMEGWGTDEEAVYGALTSRTPDEIGAIREAYFFAYDRSLLTDIEDEFSGDELDRVRRLLRGTARPAETATPEEERRSETSRARQVAQQLVDAMSVIGTEEDQIFNALEGRSLQEMAEIRSQYFALTGHSLHRDLEDELSGDDLARALELTGSTASGSFRRDFSEWLTEDYHGGGTGIWEWEIANREFVVHVGVRFAPDPGLTPPIPRWQEQIRNIWNRFALTATGGQVGEGSVELPIIFDLQDQPGAERSVRVQQNANGSSWTAADRAYSNLWFMDMRPTTAPHEFGHLVGLADEYEQTLEDYESVTNQDLPEPGEASASEQQVAADLHAALQLPVAAQRAPQVTSVLTTAGLISGGAPVQGSLAQRVMNAYNASYEDADGEDLYHAIRYRCAGDSYFPLIAVFSFSSGSVMGVQTDHTHPVQPRHLRFVLEVARGMFPDVTFALRQLR